MSYKWDGNYGSVKNKEFEAGQFAFRMSVAQQVEKSSG